MNDDLKGIIVGVLGGSKVGIMKGYYDQDGQPVSYVDLSETLRIRIGPNGPSYTVLVADHILFEGEMEERIWNILGCCYPDLAQRLKALCPKEERANE